MREIRIEEDRGEGPGERDVEVVERKGLGHPDTLCDSALEAISVALCREYLARAGRILHHNIDKGLLVAGASEPRPGGGRVTQAMRLVVGDRATDRIGGERIPVAEIAAAAARDWMRKHLRFVDPERHLVVQSELRPGSAELVGLYRDDHPRANDTSAGMGFAPFTETERLVLRCEELLQASSTRELFPEVGEDVKVMGTRRGRLLHLTVAAAFVDRFVPDAASYFRRKAELEVFLREALSRELESLDAIELAINTLDDPERGLEGMYLTVLGTSAEAGDGGEVGRGNRPCGLITPGRPMSLEAAAGKNPVAHVGKVYQLLALELARRIHEGVPGVLGATVSLVSRIGWPLDQPWLASARLKLARGVGLSEVAAPARELLEGGLDGVDAFVQRLVRGELPVC